MSDQTNSQRRRELWFLLPVVLIAFLVFANSLNGRFVYDDTRQIARNPLIQDASLYSTALTSDVWAFKGDRTVTSSNYWRPTFTGFHIINFQLFGLNPLGWHFLNLLLFAGICALIYLLLRRFEASPAVAFAVALIFAVHPVHTESVAWISGSPDLLFGLFFLSSLWFVVNYSEGRNRRDLIFALISYALALGAKEVALFCFPVFWIVFAESDAGEGKETTRRAFGLTAAFAVLGVLYFLMRWAVLGRVAQPAEGAAGFEEAFFTAPSAFIFYLKQMVFPFSLGPNYGLRAVGGFEAAEFLLPLIVSLAAVVLFYLLARRSPVQKAGFLLLFLPLIPAFNITAFIPEQIVHDRYLFLPLLGFLMLVLPYLKDLAERFREEKADLIVLILAVAVGFPLSLKTFFYNRVWTDETTLWRHSVRIDDRSSFNWAQYGTALAEEGEYKQALEAYDNALDLRPTPQVYLGRARANLSLGQLEEAVWDLRTVAEMPPENINVYTLYLTYEALAIALVGQKKFDEAAGVLLEGRRRLPIYAAALTGKLAVVYYQQGKKDLALKELEEAQNKARAELLPESKTVLFRLGMLYAELGRREKARAVLGEYLQVTSALQDKLTLEDRGRAVDALKRLGTGSEQ
ncbi:MAG: tetratricopeptide repeat protein [Pyrinomonadaceae bacterium]